MVVPLHGGSIVCANSPDDAVGVCRFARRSAVHFYDRVISIIFFRIKNVIWHKRIFPSEGDSTRNSAMIYSVSPIICAIVVVSRFGIYDLVIFMRVMLFAKFNSMSFIRFSRISRFTMFSRFSLSRFSRSVPSATRRIYHSIAHYACGLNNHDAFDRRLSVLSDIHAIYKNFRLTVEVQLVL